MLPQPSSLIAEIRTLLKGGITICTDPKSLRIEQPLPQGHVVTALSTVRKIALERLILSTAKDAASQPSRDLRVGMIIDRLITLRSKLDFVRALDEATPTRCLGATLGMVESIVTTGGKTSIEREDRLHRYSVSPRAIAFQNSANNLTR